jgi:hypothetical protein
MESAKPANVITVPMPLILNLLVPKRMPAIRSRDDCFLNVPVSFYPLNSVELRPKKFGEIDNSRLKSILEWGGIDAVGNMPPKG